MNKTFVAVIVSAGMALLFAGSSFAQEPHHSHHHHHHHHHHHAAH